MASLLGLAAYGSDSDSDASDAGAAGSVVIHKVQAASNLLVTYGDDEATDAASAKAEAGSTPAAAAATPPPASTEPATFIEARVFAGEKPGYVFMMDGSRLGYHLDNPSVARQHLQRMAGGGDAAESIPDETTAGAARGVKRKAPGDDKPLSPRSAATISAQAPLALPASNTAVAAAVHHTLQQLMPPSPPPDAAPHPEAVAMMSGISDQFGTEFFNSNLRSKKAFRNPSILSRVVEDMGIEEAATNYAPEVFDPARYSRREHYTMLASRQRRYLERKAAAAAAANQGEQGLAFVRGRGLVATGTAAAESAE